MFKPLASTRVPGGAWPRGKTLRAAVPILLTGVALHGFCGEALQTIRSTGTLRWGADAEGGAPYVFPDPQRPEQLTGFEFDLADALAANLGVTAKMVQNQWDQLVPGLERGNFDIILNGLELTAENQQQVSMSLPYYVYTEQIVVRRGTASVKTPEQLKGKTVGVLSSSVAQKLLEQRSGITLKTYPGNVETLRDLKARRLDAVVMDLPIALYYAQPDPELELVGAPFAPGYYSAGVRKQDTNLLAAINAAIAQFQADGTLERIYRKYGLWDERQVALKEYQPQAVREMRRVSTLRQWPRYLPLLLRGAVVTVELSVLAMGVAVVVGLVLVLLRLYAVPPLNWAARAYVEIIRGTPLLIQLFLIYYGLPEIGIRLNPFLAGITGLGLNYAASESENYRAGILSVPAGQTEAAQALGMTRWQTLRHIVLPQALRVVIPPVTNDFIAMFKDSSIVSVITMVELTKVYGMLAMSTYDYIGLGLMTAGIYFALSYPASIFADHLEKRLSYDRR